MSICPIRSNIIPQPYHLEAVFFAQSTPRKPLSTLVIGHFRSLDEALDASKNAQRSTPAIVEEFEGMLAAYRQTAVRAEYRIKG